MFCPSCRDEYRPGFTRCATCDVDLVDALDDRDPVRQPAAPPAVPQITKLLDFCGFFSLEDARDARDRLRESRIRCEIVIRDAPGEGRDGPVEEEYWIRVDTSRLAEVAALLGDQPVDAGQDDGSFDCSRCGHRVAESESFCPGCGARFEDD